MSHNNTPINVRLVHIVCIITFAIFTFLYLYFYKAEMLMLMQKVYSEGKTFYNPLIGGVLITVFLCVVQVLIYAVARLRFSMYWTTFFPSFLLLAWLTDVRPTLLDGKIETTHWLITVPILLIIYIICVNIARQYQQIETVSTKISYTVELLWKNILAICIMMILVGTTVNGNQTFHHEVRKEMRKYAIQRQIEMVNDTATTTDEKEK